jgi:cytochrome c-type biogenesis protein CcmH
MDVKRSALPPRPAQQTNYLLALGALFFLALLWVLAPARLHAQNDRSYTLGGKLICMCGCGQLLSECNHLNCPLRGGMQKQLDADIARGESDDLILQDFVQQYGEAVLASPPAKGFNLVAWSMPAVAFGFGLCVVILVVRNWRHRPAMAAASTAAPGSAHDSAVSAELERARRQADRETEE